MNNPTEINCVEFSKVVRKLRAFFEEKGFIEVHTQHRKSILAACEDPETMATFNYSGNVWPLPQTGQMWLEYELLNNPDLPGLFCVSTSYRNEPDPVPGRHDLIFPMFEFEMRGTMDDMVVMEKELLTYLGFTTLNNDTNYPEDDYENVALKYETNELEHIHESMLEKDNGAVFFLKNFPLRTSPFWNMKLGENGTAKKVDVILHGVETIGSAERSVSKDEMRNMFYTISNGRYAKTLFSNFGRNRVINELEQFLGFHFFDRSGGGIGLTRLIRAMKLSNLLNHESNMVTTTASNEVSEDYVEYN